MEQFAAQGTQGTALPQGCFAYAAFCNREMPSRTEHRPHPIRNQMNSEKKVKRVIAL